MPVLPTAVDRTDPAFAAHREAHLEGLATLHKHLAKAAAGGGPKYVERHRARGKLLPRERIDLLLDRDSPFLELCALAGVHERGTVPGGGLVTGIGWVHGVPCLVSASEATVQGGAVGAVGVRKAARMAQIAADNRLPTVQLVESAGADLPNQVDIFVPGGAGFRDITRRSRDGLPTLSIVFGSCTAGGAYVPGMSDVAILVKEAAAMYLAGPPLVKMAIGEEVDDETLGGAAMHARTSGSSDFLADDERDALRLGREAVRQLGWRPAGPPPTGPVEPPRHDPDDLLGLVPADVRVPFDIREVIGRVVDGSRFLEFKPLYGPTLVCGWAAIGGYRVGVLGNNGVLHRPSAEKGAQFIQLCNRSNTPLIFLQNITGFMVGRAAEEDGIIKAGAKLINAVSNSTVPAITVMVGGSYGAGHYAMMGRAYEPRFLFSWPHHRLAVMGPEQLAGVLDLVKRQSAARRGVPVDEEQLATLKQMLAGKVEHESTAWQATGRLFDDGVIDPRDTRHVLVLALRAAHAAPVVGTSTWGTVRH